MDFLGLWIPDRAVSGPQAAKNTVGDAAERLVARVIGGVPWTSRLPPFWAPESVATERDGTPYGLMPDVWWPAQSALVEVKAGIERFYTTERQWRSYLWARDTPQSGLPIDQPHVFYAFVGYRLPQLAAQYKTTHALLREVLIRLRYVLVVDSQLVGRFIGQSTSHQPDIVGPLAPMLGAWHAHWNVRVHRLQAWADRPRDVIAAHGLDQWQVSSLEGPLGAIRKQLVDAGWPELPPVAATVLRPSRPSRAGPVDIPGSQTALFGETACPRCSLPMLTGTCTYCGEFTAF